MELNTFIVDEIIRRALQEDIGTGDITTDAIVPRDHFTKAFIHTKEDGVLAGIFIAERVFSLLSSEVDFKRIKQDGDILQAGDILAELYGPARVILTGERVALNFLQRMSGIATKTRRIAGLLSDSGTAVVDTRKTTPGLRALEKYAVYIGGGKNHRFGLYDGVLIKDNHIKVAGGIKKAVEMARAYAPHTIKIEVEVETLAGVKEALEAGADIIMLDNMDIETVKQALVMINGQALVEVSGGLSEDKVPKLAELGVDIISMGALTHSVKALDISLDVGGIKTRK
ncbi:carboxylating nicotinate-nucleotide diphosphorylase [Thermincola potens]|uniref:Probable nicotinate-nucleotide pyrophosphorylase [carboxylating] n=1 Tax=Thermincola potens (strain JR) TaxID=635013 RepID=D5X9N6_THEPJ|nr:carboxylating nicotinate-nucleotide diphosphorylase [Thermincola potens]ADG81107.1 nicotinate-nucleotide pyrophosphorylase [Thermincola potens JR]